MTVPLTYNGQVIGSADVVHGVIVGSVHPQFSDLFQTVNSFSIQTGTE